MTCFFQEHSLPPIPFTVFICCCFQALSLWWSYSFQSYKYSFWGHIEKVSRWNILITDGQTGLFLLGRMKFMVKKGTSNLNHLFFLRCIKRRSNHTFKVETWRSSTMTPYYQAKLSLCACRQKPTILYHM